LSSLKPEKPIVANVLSTQCTKSPNTKRVKKARPLKAEDVMIENNQVMEDKQNQFSERKLKQLKKSPSDCNAPSVKPEDALWLEEPKVSFSWTLNKSERTEQVKEMLFINDQWNI